jgi:hypothetical protein
VSIVGLLLLKERKKGKKKKETDQSARLQTWCAQLKKQIHQHTSSRGHGGGFERGGNHPAGMKTASPGRW